MVSHDTAFQSKNSLSTKQACNLSDGRQVNRLQVNTQVTIDMRVHVHH